MDFAQTVEKNRSRIERRTAYTTHNIKWLYGKEKWSKLKCIGAIRTEVTIREKSTITWHYYISIRELSAEELLRRARLESLAVRRSLSRGYVPNNGRNHTKESEYLP